MPTNRFLKMCTGAGDVCVPQCGAASGAKAAGPCGGAGRARRYQCSSCHCAGEPCGCTSAAPACLLLFTFGCCKYELRALCCIMRKRKLLVKNLCLKRGARARQSTYRALSGHCITARPYLRTAAHACHDSVRPSGTRCSHRVAGLQEKIAALQAAFDEATAKKAALAAQVADCEAKLKRADKLTGGLGGERVRSHTILHHFCVADRAVQVRHAWASWCSIR